MLLWSRTCIQFSSFQTMIRNCICNSKLIPIRYQLSSVWRWCWLHPITPEEGRSIISRNDIYKKIIIIPKACWQHRIPWPPFSLSLSYSLSSSVLISHRSWQVFKTVSSVRTVLMNVSFCWYENTGLFIEEHCLWIRPCFTSSV